MDKDQQLTTLVQQCNALPVCIRVAPEDLSVTVTVPPSWDAVAEMKATKIQETIKDWSKQYPNVVCYCFDSFSTLLYVL